MYFPAASGNAQSPINISPEEAEFSPEEVATYPLKLVYPSGEGAKIVWNTGYTIQIEVRAKDRSYCEYTPQYTGFDLLLSCIYSFIMDPGKTNLEIPPRQDSLAFQRMFYNID